MKLVYNDSSHSYWLAGKRVKSASKVAQIASDSFTIEQWQKRQVGIGMTLDKTLAERIAVDIDNREAVQQVCDEAMNVAKANARAQRGTQRHRVFELGLLGETSKFITDQQIADWKVLERTLDRYQLEPIPDRVEQFIAWPDNGVVGRYDAFLMHQGHPVLVDLKGGENAVKYPHSTAVQLWLYRNAPHTSKTIVRNGDKSEVTEWTTHPEDADEDFAYVIYCDDHHDVGELWQIDLAAARSGGELALGIVDWRKSYNYGRDIATQVAAPVGSPDGERPSTGEPVPSPVDDRRAEVNNNKEQPCPTSANPTTESNPGKALSTSDPTSTSSEKNTTSQPPRETRREPNSTSSVQDIREPATTTRAPSEAHSTSSTLSQYLRPTTDRRSEAKRRYDLLNDEQKADYTARKQAIDTNDLDAVERLLDEVEPFNTVVEPVLLLETTGNFKLFQVAPDEGPDVDAETIAALQREFERLSDEAKFWIASLTAQGRKAGVDWRPNAQPTVRRYELARGIVRLAKELTG